jgi:hypothetical protein
LRFAYGPAELVADGKPEQAQSASAITTINATSAANAPPLKETRRHSGVGGQGVLGPDAVGESQIIADLQSNYRLAFWRALRAVGPNCGHSKLVADLFEGAAC